MSEAIAEMLAGGTIYARGTSITVILRCATTSMIQYPRLSNAVEGALFLSRGLRKSDAVLKVGAAACYPRASQEI